MAGITGKWSSRWRGHGSDKLGRWCWIDLKGRGEKMIRVISGYRVGQGNIKHVGPLTVCQQQFNSLVLHNSENLNRKKAFLQDMEEFIHEWTNGGDHHEIILMMDANDQATRLVVNDI